MEKRKSGVYLIAKGKITVSISYVHGAATDEISKEDIEKILKEYFHDRKDIYDIKVSQLPNNLIDKYMEIMRVVK